MMFKSKQHNQYPEYFTQAQRDAFAHFGLLANLTQRKEYEDEITRKLTDDDLKAGIAINRNGTCQGEWIADLAQKALDLRHGEFSGEEPVVSSCELTGSEKQIAWAKEIRAKYKPDKAEIFYLVVGKLRAAGIEIKEAINKDEFMTLAEEALSDPRAHWWIENRQWIHRAVAERVSAAIMTEKAPKPSQAEIEAKEELVMVPEKQQYDAICEITVGEKVVEVTLPSKIEDFRVMIKAVGFSWEDGRWVSKGNIAGKAEFVAAKALKMGIRVMAPHDVSERVKAGEVYERWVYTSKGGDSFLLRWWTGDWYAQCRSLPGARWAKPFVAVPFKYREEVADFAKINGFGIVKSAREEIDRQVTAEVVSPSIKEGTPAVMNDSAVIPEGLVDDEI